MEPVTHILTGACLARMGFHRRVAYATAAMAIAAEFPDIDTIWSLRGPVAAFEHHRGITHSFLGLPFEAGLLLSAFFLFHRQKSRRAVQKAASSAAMAEAPVRWGALYGLLLIALLGHLWLDYTNNYGVRPFFPFSPSWYAGSFVFIFDPLLFLLLVGGLLTPALFGLIGREVGAKRQRYRGEGWARTALIGVVLLWAVRWEQHGRALALAQEQTLRAPAPSSNGEGQPYIPQSGSTDPDEARPLLRPLRSLASPDPLSIFRWYTATDFGPAYSLATADTRVPSLVPDTILAKATPSRALRAAQDTHLGRVYSDWSAMPLVRGTEGTPSELTLPPASMGEEQTVLFTDLRFMGDIPFLKRSDRPPLSGQVVLDAKFRILAEGMDGRF